VMSSTIINWVQLNTTEMGEHHVQAISNELADIARRSVRCGATSFVHQLLDGGRICEDHHGPIAYFQLREVATIYDQPSILLRSHESAHTENRPPYFLAHSVNLQYQRSTSI
jgi:hypothetical protein